MIRHLKILTILIYVDEPQLFTATDGVSVYLCLLSEDDGENSPEYLAVSISAARLAQFIAGQLDLRDVMSHPETSDWFIINDYTEDSFIATHTVFETIPEKYLPEEGFYLAQATVNEELLAEVMEKNKPIIHLSLGLDNQHRVAVAPMADLVNSIQKIFNALSKKLQSTIEDCNMFAYRSSFGSFKLHMEIDVDANLFGQSPADEVLMMMHQLLRPVGHEDEEDEYVAFLQGLKGRSISSFRQFIEKIIANDIRVKYEWNTPYLKEQHRRVLDKTYAERVREILIHRTELAQEIRNFSGVMTRFDNNQWTILNEEDKKTYKGVAENEMLAGLVYQTQIYHITCEEFTEIDRVTGKEYKKYKIMDIKKGS